MSMTSFIGKRASTFSTMISIDNFFHQYWNSKASIIYRQKAATFSIIIREWTRMDSYEERVPRNLEPTCERRRTRQEKNSNDGRTPAGWGEWVCQDDGTVVEFPSSQHYAGCKTRSVMRDSDVSCGNHSLDAYVLSFLMPISFFVKAKISMATFYCIQKAGIIHRQKGCYV